MIKRLIVKNLHQKFDFDITFHPDLNIFTGRNGSGKTTLLKLIWYIISGNVRNIFEEEIYFDNLSLEFDYFGLKNEKVYISRKENRLNIIFQILNQEFKVENASMFEATQFLSNSLPKPITLPFSSLFFPTFRIIEGGFLIEDWRIDNNTGLKEFLEIFSSYLENHSQFEDESITHSFITGVSSFNIEELITQQYARNYVISGNIDKEQSRRILELTQNGGNHAEETVKKIQDIVQEGEIKRKEIEKPFNELTKIVEKLYLTHNIKIADFVIGNKRQTINATKLSSGEKQMLSFLAYNAFHRGTAFFIDEPELSLHTDWQRLLFPTLMAQGSTNQFFVATHSPFIYSKFPDKEHFLDHLANKKSDESA